MSEADKQQEKRRGITPRLTPKTPHLQKNPYGKTGYATVFVDKKTTGALESASVVWSGGGGRARTYDLYHVKVAL